MPPLVSLTLVYSHCPSGVLQALRYTSGDFTPLLPCLQELNIMGVEDEDDSQLLFRSEDLVAMVESRWWNRDGGLTPLFFHIHQSPVYERWMQLCARDISSHLYSTELRGVERRVWMWFWKTRFIRTKLQCKNYVLSVR